MQLQVTIMLHRKLLISIIITFFIIVFFIPFCDKNFFYLITILSGAVILFAISEAKDQ